MVAAIVGGLLARLNEQGREAREARRRLNEALHQMLAIWSAVSVWRLGGFELRQVFDPSDGPAPTKRLDRSTIGDLEKEISLAIKAMGAIDPVLAYRAGKAFLNLKQLVEADRAWATAISRTGAIPSREQVIGEALEFLLGQTERVVKRMARAIAWRCSLRTGVRVWYLFYRDGRELRRLRAAAAASSSRSEQAEMKATSTEELSSVADGP